MRFVGLSFGLIEFGIAVAICRSEQAFIRGAELHLYTRHGVAESVGNINFVNTFAGFGFGICPGDRGSLGFYRSRGSRIFRGSLLTAACKHGKRQ